MDRALEEKKSYEKNFKTLYSKLNKAQKMAVDAIEGPVMVLAGPGTGKTQILAMRIARILADPDLQVNPSNILCLTYTESGTVAMRNRLISIVGPIAYQVRIYTFHSFCNEIIKENPEKFFFANQINDLQKIQAMSNFIDELDVDSPLKPFGDKNFYRSSLLKIIQTLKRESITPDKLSENIFAFEEFINKNRDLCMEFCSHRATKINQDMRNLLMEKLHVRNPNSPYARLIQDYDTFNEKATDFKAKIKSLFEFAEKNIPRQKETLKVYIRYQEYLETNKIYDFEDMILRVIKQFKKDPDLLARYQEQFQYILADEYQDTNGSQNEILDLLVSYYQENPNIFVVGDDDQSIYRFQGASLDNIIRFYRLYENYLSLIVLEENYRSHQNILDISSGLINGSKTRIVNLIPNISKALKASFVHEKQEIEIIKTYDLIDEIFFIGKKIKSLLESGVNPTEIAILYRGNKSAIDLMDYLSRMNIPCAIDVGDNILENPLITRLIDLLKLIANPESNSDILFNVLNYDFILQSDYFKKNNIGLKDIFEINLKRRQESKPDQSKILFQYLLEDSRFAGWANKILECNQKSFNMRLDELVEKILYDFGYMKYIFESQDYLLHVSNLNVFFNELRSFIENPVLNFTKSNSNKNFGLTEFNQYLDLLYDSGVSINSKTLISRSNSVRLMTAHKSKGLEFEHVFVHACLDNVWKDRKHSSEIKLPPCLINQTDAVIDKEEDERRLFYVALTRARKGLYLLYHTYNESGRELTPSIYISELTGRKQVRFFDYTVVDDNLLYQEFEREKLAYRFKSKSDQILIPEKDFVNSLLENYKMSITHLNNFLYCPRKFFYQNLLRVPSAKDRSSSFGTAIHASLHDLMQRFKTKPPTSSQEHQEMLEYLKLQFVAKLDYERLPVKDHEDLLKKGLTTLVEYYNHYKDSLNPNVLLEYNFDAFGLTFDGIQITGKLDKIEIIDEATSRIKVVDYKTGKFDSAATKLKPGSDYHRQIVFYQLLCDLANTTGLFKYKMQSGEIDFVQKEKEVFQKSTIFVTKEDIEELKVLIQDSFQQIKEHNFKMTEEHQHCSSCNFKNICGR